MRSFFGSRLIRIPDTRINPYRACRAAPCHADIKRAHEVTEPKEIVAAYVVSHQVQFYSAIVSELSVHRQK